MSKITIESIQEQLDPIGWKIISETYKNLDEELEFSCSEGHKVFTSWKKLRTKAFCPICAQNIYKVNNTIISTKKSGVRRFLALDQASHITGYALFENRELVKSGAFETKEESEAGRVNELKQWLASKLVDWEIDYVGLEGIQYQAQIGITTFQTLARLQGTLIDLCYELGIEYKICPTNTWRHHCGVSGRSRVDKKRSMQILIKKWFDISVSDDIADAIGIGRYITDTYSPYSEVSDW